MSPLNPSPETPSPPRPSPATAFLLAAGFGTRLRPLTAVRPKPLMPLCGLPMLDHALAHVRAHGHTQVLVNAHHLWSQVATWAVQRGVQIQVELPTILGTGGGLRAATEQLAKRFVVVNADVLSDVDLSALATRCPPDGAAMALRADPLAADIGPVEANALDTVVRITSVVPGDGGIPGTHFTGVHAMSRQTLRLIPEPGEHCVIRTAYKALVPLGRVRALRHRGTWVDVGTPGAYLQANLDALAGRLRLPIDPWAHGERGPNGSWIGAGAHIEGSVHSCVVGDGAHIPSGARLSDCVVWDGCAAPAATLSRCVVYGDGQVLAIP